MQAIRTRFRPPASSIQPRKSHIIADCSAGKISIDCDNTEENHINAARKLCDKFGWSGTLVSGVFQKDERVFVFTSFEGFGLKNKIIVKNKE